MCGLYYNTSRKYLIKNTKIKRYNIFSWIVMAYKSSKLLFLLSSDQRDGGPRRDPGRAGQPGPEQPLHPDAAPHRQNDFLLRGLCSAACQRAAPRDPAGARSTDGPRPGAPCWRQGDRARPRPGSRRTSLQPHEAERRGSHHAEVAASARNIEGKKN